MRALFFLMITLICFTSCSDKLSDEDLGRKVRVQFRISGLSYENDKKASVQNSSNLTHTIKKYYYLDEDYVIEASYATNLTANSKLGYSKLADNIPAKITQPLRDSISYKVLVFDKLTDSLVTEAVYHINEMQTAALELEPGKAYKFVAFCFPFSLKETVQSPQGGDPDVFLPVVGFENQDLPKIGEGGVYGLNAGFSDPSNSTSVNFNIGSHIPLAFFSDFNYPVLSTQNINYLNIVFKQLYCQINVNVDHSNTAFTSYSEITSFNDTIDNSNIIRGTNLIFSLENGDIISYNGVPNWTQKFLKGKYALYMRQESNTVKCIVSLNLKKGNDEVIRTLTINDLPYKNGLRHNLNLKVLPQNEVPVGYDIIRLTEKEGFDEDVDLGW